MPSEPSSLSRGADLIRRFARELLPDSPGVYRMLGAKGDVLYVGKARSLKRRVGSYANTGKLPLRLKRMISETTDMMFITTHTEVEALLLESNLIKELEPKYNVIMKDDKSFPYIVIRNDHDFPLLAKHRGARDPKHDYFGPFASAGSVNRTINALHRAFMLRNCTDSYFAQRTRPCLQYHIKRCSAPCVAYIDKEHYARQIDQIKLFLKGKSKEVQERMAAEMQDASDRLDYETAARIRDRIRALSTIQQRQDINVSVLSDADVLGLYMHEGRSCVQVFFFRGGQNFGNRPYFPKHDPEDTPEDILSAFTAQFYENKPVPPEVILSHAVSESALLEEALTLVSKSRVRLTVPLKGQKKDLVDFVIRNAKEAMEQDRLKRTGEAKMLTGIANLFDLERLPERIEVYDNSHISGTNMVGGMIVAGPEGFRKTAYRKFNIREAEAADDYGMMREVLTRRFGRGLREEKGPGSPEWPDLILIDGGLGQLNAALAVLIELGIADDVNLVSIAKGPDRNAGREKFFVPDAEPFQLPIDDPILHYLQRLRDEAHRFAIGAHRTRRSKDITKSPLDEISSIGPKRKKALLMHFGSAREIARAGIKDLQRVEGISEAVATIIYNHFHEIG
jgi:excinuclease ABC subunit C